MTRSRISTVLLTLSSGWLAASAGLPVRAQDAGSQDESSLAEAFPKVPAALLGRLWR